METNRFKQNLYDEFDANCYKMFGASGTRVHEVLSERGDDLYKVFEQAFDHGGAALQGEPEACAPAGRRCTA